MKRRCLAGNRAHEATGFHRLALAPVFPLLPWFWPLLLLQIVNGGALQFAWSGSQTFIAQLSEGEAEYLGRFSFFARIGTTRQ